MLPWRPGRPCCWGCETLPWRVRAEAAGRAPPGPPTSWAAPRYGRGWRGEGGGALGAAPAVWCCCSFRTGCPPCGRAVPAAGCAGGRWRTWCRCTARWTGPPSTAWPTCSPAPGRAAGESPAGERGARGSWREPRPLRCASLVPASPRLSQLEGAALPVLAGTTTGNARLRRETGTASKLPSWALTFVLVRGIAEVLK